MMTNLNSYISYGQYKGGDEQQKGFFSAIYDALPEYLGTTWHISGSTTYFCDHMNTGASYNERTLIVFGDSCQPINNYALGMFRQGRNYGMGGIWVDGS